MALGYWKPLVIRVIYSSLYVDPNVSCTALSIKALISKLTIHTTGLKCYFYGNSRSTNQFLRKRGTQPWKI